VLGPGSVRAVIFDFDGTVVDSFEAHLESFRRTLLRFGIAVEDEEIYRRFGKPARQILKETLPEKYHRYIDEIVKGKRAEFAETSREARVFDGVEEILRYLKGRGVKVGLATSSDRKSVMRVLIRFGLDRYFDAILSSEDVEEAKPNPRIFIKTAERLGAAPGECLVVGDSIFDVIAAREAGIRVVIVANNPYQIGEIKPQGVPIVSNIGDVRKFL